MNWKEFLKPDWRKIVVFVILFILSSFISAYFNTIYSAIGFCSSIKAGFPLAFNTEISGIECGGDSSNFDIFSFILDIIFWYLLSCLIVWIYDKFRKKK